MKKFGFFIVAFLAMVSFAVFGLKAKAVNAADESENLSTSLTMEDLNEYASENSTVSNIKTRLQKKTSKYTVADIFANTCIENSIYSTSRDTTLDQRELAYNGRNFKYAIRLDSYKSVDAEKGSSGYIEFTLTKSMNITVYASTESNATNPFALDQVTYNNDDTFTITKSLQSKAAPVKKQMSCLVFTLSAGVYHLGLIGYTSYIYGIYSGNANYSKETVEDTNIENANVTISNIAADATNVVVDSVDKKLVYFIFEIDNIEDSSKLTVSYDATYAAPGAAVKNLSKTSKIYTSLSLNGEQLDNAKVKENTYYAYASIRFNNTESNDGTIITVNFTATIEGLANTFTKSNSYTFNYVA